MYLGPHHFQAQSAWIENSIHFAARALWFEPYGFAACELDAEALVNGTVALKHARGFFPDGLPFHIPDSDAAPQPVRIANFFPPTRDHVLVSLAIPAHRPAGSNIGSAEQSSDGFRYTAEERKVSDENTGLDEKLIALGRKNIRILLDTPPGPDMLTVPMARIRRDAAGRFVYDERYIPPCVSIAASTRLLLMTRRLIEILADKSQALSASGPAQAGKFSAGLSGHQVAAFWFLHALNSALPALQHLCFSHQGHPEELFLEMSRLAGALCSFGLESKPADLPLYDHLNLEYCFDTLDAHIRSHLEMVAPSNCVPIPLKLSENYFHIGEVSDTRCFGRSRWLLAVHSRIDEATLITQVPRLVKFCSARFVRELVRRAMPGLALSHVPVPPAAVSPRVASQYFAVGSNNQCWQSIIETKQVGIYVPGEIPDAELELLVLLET